MPKQQSLKNTIIDALTEFHFKQTRPELRQLKKELKVELKKLEKKMDKGFNLAKTERLELKRQIDDIKAELSDTPTRKEFDQLKTKVYHHHPTN